MLRYALIIVYITTAFTLTGCRKESPKPLPTDNVKIFDLAPLNRKNTDLIMKTMNFDVHTFEMPEFNADILSEIWPTLYTNPLKFKNEKTFSSNHFKAAIGQMQIWQQVAENLELAGAAHKNKVSIYLQHQQPDHIPLRVIPTQKTIFYSDTKNSTNSIKAEPGNVAIKITANKIPGSRGVCDLKIQPSILEPDSFTINDDPDLTIEQGDFTNLSFIATMSPSEFLLIAPSDIAFTKNSLAGEFFSIKGKYPKIRLYLIFCTNIID